MVVIKTVNLVISLQELWKNSTINATSQTQRLLITSLSCNDHVNWNKTIKYKL